MIKQFAYILATALSVITLGACSSGHGYTVPEPTEDDAYVNLRISVVANNSVPSGHSSSRAGENDGILTSPGIKPYENIHSLRVIMTDENGKVEYNEFTQGPAGASTEKIDNIVMRTHPGGSRTLYLIANEEALPQLNGTLKLSAITPGGYLPLYFINNTISAAEAGQPFFDNGQTYVPMTEVFVIDITEEKDIKSYPYTQEANLFVTRTPVKFSFIVRIPDSETQKDIFGEDYKIAEIKIHNLAGTEYLFPTDAVYSPAKSASQTDREITDFSSPSWATFSDAVLTLDQGDYLADKYSTLGKDDPGYDILEEGDRIFTYSPASYFPETKLTDGKKFSLDVTLMWEKDMSTEVFKDIELTGLRSGLLPRNTHVIVIIEMGEKNTIKATATLVPYIGVDLDPEFGFGFICPATKDDPEDPEQPEEPETTD